MTVIIEAPTNTPTVVIELANKLCKEYPLSLPKKVTFTFVNRARATKHAAGIATCHTDPRIPVPFWMQTTVALGDKTGRPSDWKICWVLAHEYGHFLQFDKGMQPTGKKVVAHEQDADDFANKAMCKFFGDSANPHRSLKNESQIK